MASRAFLLISVQPDNRLTESAHPAEELRAVPGVKRVEEVQGVYDFLVEVETSSRLTLIADNLMAKPWLKRMHILRTLEKYHPVSCSCKICGTQN
jgi:hypothetical protein